MVINKCITMSCVFHLPSLAKDYEGSIRYYLLKSLLASPTQSWVFSVSFNKLWALCHILGTKCVTCSYFDKFAPFHNQMSVIHNIFVKFL